MTYEGKKEVGETGLHHNHKGKTSRTGGCINMLKVF